MPIERPIEARFIFNGSAVAFAGRIRRPENVFIKAAAGSHLPVTGGKAEIKLTGADVAPFHYKDFVKFDTAHTYAIGDFTDIEKARDYTHDNHLENNEPAHTQVHARLENFRLGADADPEKNTPSRLFFAKALEVEMHSLSNPVEEISFHRLSAVYEGLTLKTGDGPPANLIVHTETKVFDDCDTRSKLLAKYQKDGEFREKYHHCFHPPGAKLPGLLLDLILRRIGECKPIGPIVATFVTKLQWEGKTPEHTEILHNRLTIHGLGRIYFGEIIIDEGYRRSTLLRFELGSPIGGDASACEVVSNGTHWPPRGNG